MKISRIAVVISLLMTACTIEIPDIDIPNCRELGFNPEICVAPSGDAGADVNDGAPTDALDPTTNH